MSRPRCKRSLLWLDANAVTWMLTPNVAPAAAVHSCDSARKQPICSDAPGRRGEQMGCVGKVSRLLRGFGISGIGPAVEPLHVGFGVSRAGRRAGLWVLGAAAGAAAGFCGLRFGAAAGMGSGFAPRPLPDKAEA